MSVKSIKELQALDVPLTLSVERVLYQKKDSKALMYRLPPLAASHHMRCKTPSFTH